MAMFNCQRCGYAHSTDDICESLLAPEPSRDPSFPCGWLVKNDDGGWDWVGHRLAAVAAKTEGRQVYNLSMETWA